MTDGKTIFLGIIAVREAVSFETQLAACLQPLMSACRGERQAGLCS